MHADAFLYGENRQIKVVWGNSFKLPLFARLGLFHNP